MRPRTSLEAPTSLPHRHANGNLSDVAGSPTWADIRKEFDESLGYVRQDIKWLQEHDCGLNYTVALLVGCGCEMLAAARGDKKRRGERVFAELLPAGDWCLLSDSLYTALRDGLAHGFDTKHLIVDGQAFQIYISWRHPKVIEIRRVNNGLGLWIGVQALATALCAEIGKFEKLLQQNEAARRLFRQAWEYQRLAPLNQKEAAAWRKLAAPFQP
jgi:hypothetical protein